MKTMKQVILAACCLVLVAGAAWAVDYTKMSNDELSGVRGTIYNASQEEWNAFHTEWWKRLSQMTPEERQKYMGQGMGRGMGRGMGKGMGRGGCCAYWAAPPATEKAPAGSAASPATGK
jgi:hypothetical protein